jgi:acetyl esterase/lipase
VAIVGAIAVAISFCRVDMVCCVAIAERIPAMTVRMKMISAIIFLLFIGAIILFTGCTSFQLLNSTVPKWGYVATLNVAYGSDARQKLDVYRPKKSASGKVVIFFYGGSWRTGSKTDYRFVAEALTSRGFIAVLPDYRVYPEVTFPKFVEDGASSVRWVQDNISKFGGDTNQIYLMGHSAGSHIAALLTLDAHYLKDVGLNQNVIRATAGLSGPYDFIPNPWDRPVFGLATNDTYINPQIEPIHFVDGKEPPMLLVQGLCDKIVAPSNATNLAARIRESGGQVQTIFYPGRGHKTVALALASKFHWLAPVLDDVTDYFNRH